jgi:hypothetical protein
MSNINNKVKTTRHKKTIKITPEDIKISLEKLIDDVNKKTSSIQKEIDCIGLYVDSYNQHFLGVFPINLYVRCKFVAFPMIVLFLLHLDSTV